MQRRHPQLVHGNGSRSGFTLLESALAMLLTSVLMIVSLWSVGAARRREGKTVDRLRAEQVACDLLNEVLTQAYQEPTATVVFGPETGENNGTRILFDDVDDYNGWSSTPPKDRNGTVISGLTGWTQTVQVAWANPTTWGTTSATNTGLKRITVTISKSNQAIATLTGFRSIAWTDTIPSPTDATGNHAPVAVATGSNLIGSKPRNASFNASLSTDIDGDTLSYIWNFGDGSTGTGTSVSKVYNTAGVYTCTLTAYDGRGGIGTFSLTVIVWP